MIKSEINDQQENAEQAPVKPSKNKTKLSILSSCLEVALLRRNNLFTILDYSGIQRRCLPF